MARSGTANAVRNKGNISLQDVHIMDGSEQEDRDLKVSIPRSAIFINLLYFSVSFLAFFSFFFLDFSKGFLDFSLVSWPYAECLGLLLVSLDLSRVSWIFLGFPGHIQGSWTIPGYPGLSQGFLDFLIASGG
jgi:hypothetical protein